MSFAVAIALAAGALLLAIALCWGLLRDWQQQMEDTPLPFFGMLRRRELTPQGLASLAHEESLERAVKRCRRCRSKDPCRAWLAADAPVDALPACPNAGLFLNGSDDRRAPSG